MAKEIFKNPKTMRATAWGFSAILMWGMLALLTSWNRNIPPFELTAMTFTVAFIIGVLVWLKDGADFTCLKQPLSIWLTGVIGLFGYHFFYFTALRNSPPIEASLIAYLWPLLIVLFSSFLPGEKLHWFHLCGAIMGFVGATLLILKGGAFMFKQEYMIGYLLAFVCALIWSIYSVISRKLGQVPTTLVGAFCGITALLSFACHLIFEKTVVPMGVEWISIVMLGMGPIGVAFFVWDYGVKNGNIKLLGTLSYAAPLISSILLIAFGLAELTINVVIACLFIVGGAAVASLDIIRRYR
jgi:drug/metabolite transporter (DMT)-like permease